MDLEPAIASGQLRVICRYPEATSLEDLLVELQVELEELKPSLVVIDSISSIEHSSSPRAFREFMIGVAAIFREHGKTALLTQTVSTVQPEHRRAPFLSTLADAILAVEYSTTADDRSREMRVIKTRGSSHEPYPYRLSLEVGGPVVSRLYRESNAARGAATS
jgi:circadian clock protein KaiC